MSEQPSSISWDKLHARWLVIENGHMVWIKEDGAKFYTTAIPPVIWGKINLKPTAAAVSPSGEKVAITAALETPQEYKETHVVVLEQLFLWDGVSQQVKPAFDPSTNGVPRYVFKATGSPWAHVQGNIDDYNLQETIDPEYIIKKDAAK